MLLLYRLNLEPRQVVVPPIVVAPPNEIHPGIFTRPVRIIAYDAGKVDDRDIEDILIMVSHLWH